MPVTIPSVHIIKADLENLFLKAVMYKVGSLALSHNIFKWNKVSNGKFRKSRYTSTKYFTLGIEVAEIPQLCLCSESTDRKVSKCRMQVKNHLGKKH